MKFASRPMKIEVLVVAALPLALAACSDGAGSAAAAGADVTYYRDIKPIMEASCADCHTEGGIAPFALTSYEDVSAHKDDIRWAVSERIMPPWMPAEGCADYKGDRSLNDEQIAMIASWADAGAPAGDPKDMATGERDTSVKLSRIDLELPMPEAYTPTIAPDDYRCFILDWPEKETKYVTGLGIAPGAPEELHHMIAFIATPESVADYEALDAAEPGPGYTCYGGPGGKPTAARWLGGWVPGSVGYDLPENTGIEMEPGSKIILQLHYNTLYTPPAADKSTLLLRVDDKVEKKGATIPFVNPQWVLQKQMPIPPHSQDVTHSFLNDPTQMISILSDGSLESNVPITIHNAGLHMHTRGKRAITSIERADGSTECMLDIPRWNFHWQGNYQFDKPKTVSPGDKLLLECAWDNTSDAEINWGEGTTDEMCLGVFYITE